VFGKDGLVKDAVVLKNPKLEGSTNYLWLLQTRPITSWLRLLFASPAYCNASHWPDASRCRCGARPLFSEQLIFTKCEVRLRRTPRDAPLRRVNTCCNDEYTCNSQRGRRRIISWRGLARADAVGL